MAEERFYTILTNIGKAKVANAALLNSNVSLTTLKVGDGNGAYYNPTEEQTELKNTVYTCPVGSTRIDKDNPNWVVVETIIPGSVGGFTIREVGLFDVEGDLIAIGKYPETYKPVVANGASKDLNVRTIFEVSNAASVNLSINPSIIIATKEDISNLQKQVTQNATDLNEIAQHFYYSLKEINSTFTDTTDLVTVIKGMKDNSSLQCRVADTGGIYPRTPYSNLTIHKSVDNAIAYFSCPNTKELFYQTYRESAGLSGWIDISAVDSGWLDLPLSTDISSETGYTCQYRKVGKIVMLRGMFKGVTNNSIGTIIATLPAGYRPSAVNMTLCLKSTNDSNYAKIAISANGTIMFKGSDLTTITNTNAFFLTETIFFID